MIGFGLRGELRVGARMTLRLASRAADAGLAPVTFTEVSGFDATCLAAAFAARRPRTSTGTGIVPLGSRTAATMVMAARTIAELSQAPYLLGVGVSTRQIVEDWHAEPYEPGLAATRDRLEQLRRLANGETRGSFGLPPSAESEVRILLGAMGPKMLQLGLEHADGVIVNHTPPNHLPSVPEGKSVMSFCWVIACDDGETRARREMTAYILAAPYARHFTAMGWGDAVQQVRHLYQSGRLREAPETLPSELLDALYVTPAALPERLTAIRAAGALPMVIPLTGNSPVREIDALLDDQPWQ